MSDLNQELIKILNGAGIAVNTVEEVIGLKYRFECDHGSHSHLLVGRVQNITGTIDAMELSDEGGLMLYVSNPWFWGAKLIGIVYSNNSWRAYIDIKAELQKKIEQGIDIDLSEQFFKGTLTVE